MAKALRLQKVTRTAIYEPAEPGEQLPEVPSQSQSQSPSPTKARNRSRASRQPALLGADTPLTDATLQQATAAKQALKGAERAKLALAVRSLAVASKRLRAVPGAGNAADTLDRALKLSLTQQGQLRVRSGLVVWTPERTPYLHGEAPPIDVAQLDALDAATAAVKALPNPINTANNLYQAATFARASLDQSLAKVSSGAAAPQAADARKALAVAVRVLQPAALVGADGPFTPAAAPTQTSIKAGQFTMGPGQALPVTRPAKPKVRPRVKAARPPASQQLPAVRPAAPACPVCAPTPAPHALGRWWQNNKTWVPWVLAGVLALRAYR